MNKDIDSLYQVAIESGKYDLGLELAIKQASSQGYSIVAYHGTYSDFNEFKKGDIGFHFSKDIMVARNRIDDTYLEAIDKTYDDGIIYIVALSLHNPYVMKCDLGNWRAEDFIRTAYLKVANVPFQSPSTMFLCEQRFIANESYKFLKKLGFTKEDIVNVYGLISLENYNDLTFLDIIRDRMHAKGYDGIVYVNDYECLEGDDSTCYIVLEPNQVKSIEPIYDVDNSLISLSKRFDFTSPKFR